MYLFLPLSFSPSQVGVHALETLPPNQSLSYTWDEPLGQRAIVIEKVARAPTWQTGSTGRTGRGGAVPAADRDSDSGTTLVGVYVLDIIRSPSTSGGVRIGNVMRDERSRRNRMIFPTPTHNVGWVQQFNVDSNFD